MKKRELVQKFTSPNGTITVHQEKRETVLYIRGTQESFTICLSHDDMKRMLNNIRKDVNTAQRRHKNNLVKRNRYRNTVCRGCRHNYYNFAKGQSPRGDVAVSEDYYCWYIEGAKPKRCLARS